MDDTDLNQRMPGQFPRRRGDGDGDPSDGGLEVNGGSKPSSPVKYERPDGV
jgi:hypothetical protein